MSTLSQLVTRAEQRWRDTSNAILTSAEWESYGNEAYRRILGLTDWPFLETTNDVSISTGVRSGSLPSDTATVLEVYDKTNDNRVEPEGYGGHGWNIADEDDTGTIELYRQTDTSLFVFPAPDSSVTLEVTHTVYPGDLASGDSPVFPSQYHDLLLEGMMAMAYEDDGDLERADKHEQRFVRGIQRMRDALIRQSEPESLEE